MKNKRTKNKQHGHGKRKKVERYWIEDCADSYKAPDHIDLDVAVSRVQLVDDHLASKKQDVATAAVDAVVEGTKQKEKEVTHDKQVDTLKKEQPVAASKPPPHSVEDGKAPCVCIKRKASAKGPIQKHYAVKKIVLLPNGDCGDGVVNPHAKTEVADKYWAQRKRLFVQFDKGIQLDREGWYSVTPEVIANHIAQRVTAGVGESKKMVILDACAGVGGNSIAFARRPEVALVVCVDTDDARLRLAANNCRVYGVPDDKVVFIRANVCQVLASYKNGSRVDSTESSPKTSTEQQTEKDYAYGGLELLPENLDAVFLSPPWGGSDYEKVGRRHYDLSCISMGEAIDGEELLRLAGAAVPEKHMNVSYFLPRNTNGVRFSHSALKAGFSGCLDLEQNVVNGKLKTITAYLDVKSKEP